MPFSTSDIKLIRQIVNLIFVVVKANIYIRVTKTHWWVLVNQSYDLKKYHQNFYHNNINKNHKINRNHKINNLL